MIAAGICLMGGCFAQNEDFSLAEGYWPCEYVGIPSSPSSMALYEYSVVPEGVDTAGCFVFTRQVAHSNYISSFFVFQDNMAALNCYISKASVGTVLEIATNTP